MSEAPEHLPFFVYGTLLPEQPNAHLWQDAAAAWTAATLANGRLYDMGHYPMLIEEGNTAVHGMVCHVAAEAYTAVQQRLDELEGYDPARPETSAYRRVARQVTLQDGRSVRAWVYVGQKPLTAGRPSIPGGNWLTHAAAKADKARRWRRAIRSVRALHHPPGEADA